MVDAGAIEVAGIDGDRLHLRIRADLTTDQTCDFRQWFHFRVQGAAGRRLTLLFTNAGACTYPGGWPGYRVCASIDTEHWFRIDTDYDGAVMAATVQCEHDSIWFAYFEPYPWQRHLALLGHAQGGRDARSLDLGGTLDGRDFNGIAIGNPHGKPAWIIARQHPGETMAEWFVEGMIERLLDVNDSLARTLLDHVRFYIVPNMNPDGSVRGNLRANGAGANLNREWMNPSRERSPEVLAVRERMLATGCEFFLDVHGDEALPYVFVAGSEMLPSYTEHQGQLQKRFCDQFKLASPDFQTEHGYDPGKYSQDALKLASKWVGHEFGCLSLTLEMPFKDNNNLPNAQVGWNGARSKALGRAALAPMWAVLSKS
ncbi:MAG TPA: M14-type cytosolic carboxypeptidase [Burkholderiaceae bacterium]|nr:M14-type cytosolic carboxypeptidase [Burkholderiaceae bacterium]